LIVFCFYSGVDLCVEFVVKNPVAHGGIFVQQSTQGVDVASQGTLSPQLLVHEVGNEVINQLKI